MSSQSINSDYVILGPEGTEYWRTNDDQPFFVNKSSLRTSSSLSLENEEVVITKEVFIIDDDEEEAPLPRKAALKCKQIINLFFTMLDLYGEEF